MSWLPASAPACELAFELGLRHSPPALRLGIARSRLLQVARGSGGNFFATAHARAASAAKGMLSDCRVARVSLHAASTDGFLASGFPGLMPMPPVSANPPKGWVGLQMQATGEG